MNQDDSTRPEEDQKNKINYHPSPAAVRRLSDFTTTRSMLKLIPLAVIIGVCSAFIALFLLGFIGFITNLLYYQQVSFRLTSPRDNTLGAISILIPVLGGLIVGFMARYGSERIRGHGIPEAIETILVGGSRIEPKLTVLKPVSSAISIGTGGPFGAEGPIILTGGAMGSLIAQFLKLTAIERRSLLVAGAAGGMSAVFGTPVAAVLLGVELLVFEWKPRSFVPAAIASAVAEYIRQWFVTKGWVKPAPLFPVNSLPLTGMSSLLDAVILGVACGAMAWVLTKAVYGAEDAFRKLPIHWMWWPILGGLIVGIGGLIEPHALGVGYDTIADELAGKFAAMTLVSIFVVKLIIWAVALGSGTSGGILAPILMMGAALGGLLGMAFPGRMATDWAVLGMAGALAGVTRSPFTSIVFALELTHNLNLLLPLLVTATLAHLISVLVLKRSILTEKVARRGFHVLREYSVAPLEVLFASDVMSAKVLTLPEGCSLKNAEESVSMHHEMRHQRLLPVLKEDGRIAGVVSWQDLLEKIAAGNTAGSIDDHMLTNFVSAYPDESLRTLADRMAASHTGVLPVVERDAPHRFCGLLTQANLLTARDLMLQEERKREQVLHFGFRFWGESRK